MMTRFVKVFRYDPADSSAEGEFRTYEVDTTPGMSVMDVLDTIHARLDPSLSYYSHSACLHGICGRCFVKVNGKTVLACETRLPDDGDVVIGPAGKGRVVKDLVTRPHVEGLVAGADHFMVLAGNLETVVAAYRDTLGFTVQYGGRNEAIGYENHLIHFGHLYVEILSLLDWEGARAGGLIAGELADRFEGHEALCLTYAVRTEDIGELTRRVGRYGLEAVGPFDSERKRPDGRVARWRLSLPGGIAFNRAHTPFFIEWITGDEERLGWEGPVNHPNGAVTIAGFRLAVRDLEAARKFYEGPLGCALLEEVDMLALGARCARYRIGGMALDLVAPSGDGPVGRFLESAGEGPFEICFAVEDIDQTAAFLRRRNVKVEPAAHQETGLLIDDPRSFGLRIVFMAKEAS